MKAKPILIFAAVAAALILARKRSAGVGKLSDNEVELDNILKGVERGWYTARPDILNGMYVVYLAGQKTDGERTEDVYPISKSTYDALTLRGVGALPRVKRRIYKEVSLAQSAGVDFSKKFDELTEDEIVTLETVGSDANWKQSKRAKESGKSYAESYYGSLKRAWNAVSGCEGVGTAYNVKDADGNIVLTWIEDAAAHVEAERSAEDSRRRVEELEREIRKTRNRMKARDRKIQREGLMPAEKPQEPTEVKPTNAYEALKATSMTKKEQKEFEREAKRTYIRELFDQEVNRGNNIPNQEVKVFNTTIGQMLEETFVDGDLRLKNGSMYLPKYPYKNNKGWHYIAGTGLESLVEKILKGWDIRRTELAFADKSIGYKRLALLDKAKHMDIFLAKDGTKLVLDPYKTYATGEKAGQPVERLVDNIITATGDDRYNHVDKINYVAIASSGKGGMRTYYPVRAFADKEDAEQFAKWRGIKYVLISDVNIDAITGVPND